MILDKIVQNSRSELNIRKQKSPFEKIKELAMAQSCTFDLGTALQGDKTRIIAEIKKASPSRGIICHNFNPVEIARTYAENGAAAISILTETKYFLGSLGHLKQVNCALGQQRPPILRKDFIFDPYQIYETKAYGADALLLIAALLNPEQLRELLQLSHTLSLKCLVEVHKEEEIEMAVGSGAKIIGINNRDLKTFQVDIRTTERLRPLIPSDRIVVSESGIQTRRDMEILQRSGINAALIGESIISSNNIGLKIRELL